MAPVMLLLVLAQAPEPEPRIIVVPVPQQAPPAPPPSAPLNQPIPPPLSPQPEVLDAGAPLPPLPPLVRPTPAPVFDAGVPAPVPVPSAPAAAPVPAPAPASAPVPVAEASPPSGLVLRGGIEAGINMWPQGNPQDLLFFIRPLVSFDAGEDFAAELGATLNLLVFDDPPENRSNEIGGFLRRADWDEPSDFGQLIRLLRIGRPDGALWVRAGAVRLKTLGNGHLINRYSNQDLADYHPASGNGGFRIGAVRAEFFASDVFAARLFSGLLGLEFGRVFSNDPRWYDRFWLTFELAHDIGEAGGPLLTDGSRLKSPGATVMELDFTATLYRSAASTVNLLLGGGLRPAQRVDFGALLGLSIDTDLKGLQLAAKIEARKQAGYFRQGYFGPQYEVSRFVGAGFSGAPLAEQVLPDGWSVYAELRFGSRGFLVGEGAIEYFTFGRTDVDFSLQAEFLESRVVTSLRFAAVALGVLPRFAVTAEARVRIYKSFYVLGSGGTVFFPLADHTLQRGVFVLAGAGLDFEAGL
ncbi:MAG: hypothetical protein IPJ65_38570 [Archangiaceae bacterium]|nr:hypothetical protein [Archangiaceae bacterium]